MERLMPTNREAQKKYLPFPLDEDKPERTSMAPEQTNEEEKKMSKVAMKYREVKELEEDKAEDTKGKEEEGDEKTSEDKEELVQRTSNWARKVQNQPAQRLKVRQQSILQYVNTSLRGTRNIM
ncbi:uncharacterized protein LOC143818463 [Ranitomeya variabilis]|uniref:uncharacterized protein LOC143818463 n=1 Tax=Ranitomeya variabilis TaxID=490064 RepID=UPI004056C42D